MTTMKVDAHPIQSGGVGDGGIEGIWNSLPPHSIWAANFHLLDNAAICDAPRECI